MNNMTKFERMFKMMTKPWVIVVSFALIALVYFYVDRPVSIAVHHLELIKLYPFLDPLTDFGFGAFYMVFFAIIAIIIRALFHNELWERRAWFLWICVVVPNLICLILKVLLGRARPDMLFSAQMYGFYGLQKYSTYWSFPSGHTTTIMGLMFGLSAMFPRFLTGFVLFGAVIACSRVLLLKHYLSDVMIASYLALLEVGLMYYWLSEHVKYENK